MKSDEAKPQQAQRPPTESDRALMIRAHDGDMPAALALLDRYMAPLFNLAFRATGEPGLAGDVVRDCLAAAVRDLARRLPPPDERWFIDLAADVYRALLRAGLRPERPGRRLRISPRQWDPAALHPTGEISRAAARAAQRLRRRLWRAWARLSLQQRFVLALTESHPVSVAELARALGESEIVARNIRDEAKLALMAFLAHRPRRPWALAARRAASADAERKSP